MAEKQYLLSVVIPCYNEADVIEKTNKRFLEALGEARDFDLQLVYVNDGSSDHTSEILNKFVT
ncbi:MAG: glycosyltransferase, partial [Rhodospirillales bacterium]|nr:glycosyltransferase [Rhodospirillales bacterium]